MAELANTLAFATDDPELTILVKDVTSRPVNLDVVEHQTKSETEPRDRDSGVFFSDHDESPSRPLSQVSSISLKHSVSTKPTTLQRADSTAGRLRRPAELNLGANTKTDRSRPKSELELRYDLIRNSQNKSKAALKSPTQLLHDRLNLSPKKNQHDKIRTFTPPKPMLNGCILPGPAVQMEAFAGSSVRGRTELGQRPTWWCKFDKVVVFDGVEESNGEMKFRTRTSKGLTIARRRGDTETVMIPMDCTHCQEMLNRTEWKYDVQVCKRGVCWDCKERCRWELDQENAVPDQSEAKANETRVEANRERADSVLQDEQVQDEELMAKIGIEQGPGTPIDTVGGIEERLEHTGEPSVA